MRFLKDRLGLDVTYYNSETKDEVVQLSIPELREDEAPPLGIAA